MIGPCDAERELGFTTGNYLGERSLKQLATAKPIVPVDESGYSVGSREISLMGTHFWHPKVVKPEIRWQMRLWMATKQRFGSSDVGPLGEPGTPPFVILGNRVELRQVERKNLDGGVPPFGPIVGTTM